MNFKISCKKTDPDGSQRRITFPEIIRETNTQDAVCAMMRRICYDDPIAVWDYDTIETSDGSTLEFFRAESVTA